LERDNNKGVGASITLNVMQVNEIGKFVGLNSFVDNLILNPLFNLSQWRDLRTGLMYENLEFGHSSNSRIYNELKVTAMRWGRVKTESCSIQVLSE